MLLTFWYEIGAMLPAPQINPKICLNPQRREHCSRGPEELKLRNMNESLFVLCVVNLE